ncbi:MAG: T9SS type A sorting domain-containing protein [Bacteroidales bacterium]|nr:T9SS type A sorting domain-containing protein [Bacteroidales bacterium]
MKKTKQILLITIIFFIVSAQSIGQNFQNYPSKIKKDNQEILIDTRIDNMAYWKRMAALGLVSVTPNIPTEKAIYKGSKIKANSVFTENSPDVPVTTENSTQSENSIFVDPNNNDFLLNSNNSTTNPVGSLYGANDFFSSDAGLTWGGEIYGAGGDNSGDPTTAISLNGTMYVGYIHNNYGQGISYSTNGGLSWTPVLVAPPSGGLLDKNHLWIDNSLTSPYAGNLYDAWTPFGGPNDEEIELARSTDGGLTWFNAVNISSAVNAGSHNQGVNIQTGPNGKVYAAWSIYDSWPSDETAIGFTKSPDAGIHFDDATRIISNIRGIRTTKTSKYMRCNSFPVMAVDISGGPYNGYIYVVWSNIGIPGINTGPDIDVYMIKSTDEGNTWSSPIKVNQDPSGLGKEHYFPWISCDPENGALSVVFYDDRNVGSDWAEVFCANSFDAGETWEDFQVSDVAFKPCPIPGLASDYFGDYLGIIARGGKVYPCWTDNRSGSAMTYVSPYQTNNLPKPSDLTATLNELNGEVILDWSFEMVAGFQYFSIYRDDVVLNTTTDTTYTDNLPDYGIYIYKVTAIHDEGESLPAKVTVQWGNAQISVNPAFLNENLDPDSTSTQILTISNIGELDLIYDINVNITTDKDSKDYCSASGGCDEFISNVLVGSINNPSACDNYADYTNLSTLMDVGEDYPITVTNGNPYSNDQCGIWIDWNQNEDFSDAGEQITVNGTPGNGPYTATITPPTNAVAGTTVMRIRIMWTGTLDPCGTTSYGEVEDYSINVMGWLFVEPMCCDTILANESKDIQVTFDATGLSTGIYTADIIISSNDPDDPQLTVPVTLTVGENVLNVTATANPSAICEGESSQLNAIAVGGTGNYTYSWTSNPPGFTSTLPDPVVSPTVTTVYTVEVDDGVNTAQSSVTVTIIPFPSVPGTPTGETELCENSQNTTYTTTAAANASSYIWNLSPTEAGSITGGGLTGIVDWNYNFSGQAIITVKGVNECGEGEFSDELIVTVHPLPNVTLEPFDNVCLNYPPFELTGGLPEGGTYSGTGVSNNWFDPVAAGIGTHIITYTYIDQYGCENFAEETIYVDGCTGIKDIVNGLHIEIFPNPSKGIFTLILKSDNNEMFNIKILNLLGVEIYKENNITVFDNFSMNIDLSGIEEGLYFINLTSNNTNYIKKFIIRK